MRARLRSAQDASQKIPTPPYITALSVARLHSGKLKVRPLLACSLLLAANLIVSLAWDHDQSYGEVLCIYGASFVALAGVLLLVHAYTLAVGAVDSFRGVLRTEQQSKLLEQHLAVMFGGGVQNRFALAFCLVGVAIVVVLGPVGLDSFHYSMTLLIAVVFFAVSGFGLGLALTTMNWIRNLPRFGRLRLFVLPGRTPALRSASRLTGSFAVYFSAQSALEIVLFLAIPWHRQWMVKTVMYSLMWPIVVFAISFCFWPQLAIRRVIAVHKRRLLREFWRQGKIVRLEGLSALELEPVARLYSRIEDSSDFALDVATVSRFISSFFLPGLAILVQVLSVQEVRKFVEGLLW